MEKLRVENITVKLNGKNIIENININLKEGEIVSILGISGSGKTTLFNTIAGLIMPVSGKIILNNEEITGETGKVSYMLQKDLLLPFKTIEDNISLPLILKGKSKKEARDKIKEYFSKFGLEGTEKKYPKELSGGMRQRAALLRTYMFSKEIALLDEPFSALDEITKFKMHEWYLEIMKKIKLSTIFITHDIDEAILLSNRIYILSGKPGKMVKELEIDLKEKGKILNNDIILKNEFLYYKKEILKLL